MRQSLRVSAVVCVVLSTLLTTQSANAKILNIGTNRYEFIMSQPDVPLAGLMVDTQQVPSTIVAFDHNRNVYDMQVRIGAVVMKPRDENKLSPLPRPDDITSIGQPAYGSADINLAYLADPYEGYTSRNLGRAITSRSLKIWKKNGASLKFSLPAPYVVEDVAPTLIDLGRDQLEEVLLPITNANEHTARLGLFVPMDDRIVLAGQSEALAKDHWFSPIGAADVDGDGQDEIMAIDAPDVNGFLMLFSLQNGQLIQKVRHYGYTNHKVGTLFTHIQAIMDIDGDSLPEILLARNDMLEFTAVSFGKGYLQRLFELKLDAAMNSNMYVATNAAGQPVQVAFLLEDGKVAILSLLAPPPPPSGAQ